MRSENWRDALTAMTKGWYLVAANENGCMAISDAYILVFVMRNSIKYLSFVVLPLRLPWIYIYLGFHLTFASLHLSILLGF